MNCPVCVQTALVMTERKGIEIDYCPKCRGVWLDRGELDKLIEKSTESDYAAPSSPPPPQQYPQHAPPPPPGYGYRKDMDDSKYGYKYADPYKRKKAWWSEIFD